MCGRRRSRKNVEQRTSSVNHGYQHQEVRRGLVLNFDYFRVGEAELGGFFVERVREWVRDRGREGGRVLGCCRKEGEEVKSSQRKVDLARTEGERDKQRECVSVNVCGASSGWPLCPFLTSLGSSYSFG